MYGARDSAESSPSKFLSITDMWQGTCEIWNWRGVVLHSYVLTSSVTQIPPIFRKFKANFDDWARLKVWTTATKNAHRHLRQVWSLDLLNPDLQFWVWTSRNLTHCQPNNVNSSTYSGSYCVNSCHTIMYAIYLLKEYLSTDRHDNMMTRPCSYQSV